MKLDH